MVTQQRQLRANMIDVRSNDLAYHANMLTQLCHDFPVKPGNDATGFP